MATPKNVSVQTYFMGVSRSNLPWRRHYIEENQAFNVQYILVNVLESEYTS